MMPLQEPVLLQVRVEFDLVGRGRDGRGGDEALHLREGEVGNPDGAGLALLLHGLHGFVGVDIVGHAGLDVAVLVPGHHGASTLEGGGPVHEVEVEVVCAEVFEGGVDGGFDVGGVVAVIPELGGDEDFGAGDSRLFDGLAYGGLSA